jgi:hypothetical protein
LEDGHLNVSRAKGKFESKPRVKAQGRKVERNEQRNEAKVEETAAIFWAKGVKGVRGERSELPV